MRFRKELSKFQRNYEFFLKKNQEMSPGKEWLLCGYDR